MTKTCNWNKQHEISMASLVYGPAYVVVSIFLDNIITNKEKGIA